MTKLITDMKNLGSKTAQMLRGVDIITDEDLRAVGSVEAYQRLKLVFGRRVSVIALYAMEAALKDCHWRAIDGADKQALRASAGLPPSSS